MFTAVLILILLTEMVIYAVHTGVFEQRKSSNEMRQKQAFHIADSAIQEAKIFLLKNSILVSSDEDNLVPIDIDAGTFHDGWLPPSPGARWSRCSAAGLSGTSGSHPCFAEPVADLRDDMYFYEFGGSNALPLNPPALGAASATEQVTLHALLCMLDLDRSADPVVQGCATSAADQDNRYFLVTLVARGQADCDAGGANCKAEALVSEKVGSFGPGGSSGGPGVPLTARTSVPLSGTVEIVPNPNGGGIGVPVSTWANTNDACPPPAGESIEDGSGSWTTCERHEWYGSESYPSDFKCPTHAGCRCLASEDDRLLSHRTSGSDPFNFDVVKDDDFPCDIFRFTFGVPKTDYLKIKESVLPTNRLHETGGGANSCGTLDEGSFGVYWISGDNCNISTTQTVGSVKAPVFLIAATADTQIHGSFFGVLFVTDVEDPSAEFSGNGHGTIYGAAVMDASMKHFNGTFQIVYLENVINQVIDAGGFGSIQGGWTDFHATWQ